MISLQTPGTTLQNRYLIQRTLGQGGMGAVYLAQDMRLGNKPVALKENFDSSPQAQVQFQTEAVLLANLSHPNLPRVTDHFVEPSGRQYLVMDYVAGDDLESRVESSGPLPVNQAVQWTIQVLNALVYLHSQSPPVIHRDIKPPNIRVTPAGKAMLVDFGISKAADPRMKTATGARAVSPGYSPVEQYGQGRTDARSDIYALGATLYYLLTGQAPRESIELISGQAQLVPPSQLNRAIPPHIESVILKAMQLAMGQRYGSAAEMKQALVMQPGAAPQRPIAQSHVALSAGAPPIQPAAARPNVAAPPVSRPAPRPVTPSLPFGIAAADNGARFVAYLIDSVISTVLGLVVGAPCYGLVLLMAGGSSSSSDAASIALLFSAVPATLVVGWYYVHFHAKTGQTWGKKWLRIKVVDESGRLISRKRALGRWLAFWALPALGSLVGCGLPVGYVIYAWPLFNSEHRALHDLIAKTSVIKE